MVMLCLLGLQVAISKASLQLQLMDKPFIA